MLSFTIAKQRWERVHHEWVWMLLGTGFDLKGWGWLSLAFIAFCSFRQGYIVIPSRLPVFVVLEDISFSRLYAIHFVYNLIQSERSGYQGVQLIKLIRKFLFQNYYSCSLENRLDIIYYGLDGTSEDWNIFVGAYFKSSAWLVGWLACDLFFYDGPLHQVPLHQTVQNLLLLIFLFIFCSPAFL